MNMIDHLSLGVPSIDQGAQFYAGLLATLGYEQLALTDGFAAYGKDAVQFLIMQPENGAPSSSGNGTHICFVAPSAQAVDAFHEFAQQHGGECAGAPGTRDSYPIPDIYTAFVRDPFGNKLEAITNGFSA